MSAVPSITAESPLRVFIVDDEAPARLRLRALLEDLMPELPSIIVGEADNGADALQAIEQAAEGLPVQVALLDIRMPGMEGIELATHLSGLAQPPGVVFCTAYDQYAVQAFELNAIDYLMKPVRLARLQAALIKAAQSAPLSRSQLLQINPDARRQLSCTERGRILLFNVSDVLYLKAEQKYVVARTAEREYLLEESLVALEQEFGERFMRIHRNCLVARQAVAGFERSNFEGEAHWEVVLHGLTEHLPVSRRQWSNVKQLCGS